MTMATETLITTGIALAALIFTALSFRRNVNADNSISAQERATMTADIRYIRTAIDDIKLENKSIQKDLGDLKTKVAEIDQSAKSAHKRLDDITRRENL